MRLGRDQVLPSRVPERGMVLLYIFLGIVLLAALAAVLSGMLRVGGDTASSERDRLSAQSLLAYTEQAKTIVQRMRIDGVAASNLSFLKDGDAGYTTAPHTAKVFHPQGGALPLPRFRDELVSSSLTPTAGIYMARATLEGVDSAEMDVVLSIRGVRENVCASLNRQLTGSDHIPTTGVDNHDDLFINNTQALNAATCASCVGQTALCVMQTSPILYTFYRVVDGN